MYSESGTALRQEMTALLNVHRVDGRFGARDEMADHVILVRHFRENVLAWCGSGLQLALPVSFSNMPPRNPNPFESTGTLSAARELARQLAAVRQAVNTTPAVLTQLTTPHRIPLVERWRQVARAAAMAEADLDGMGEQAITSPQAGALVGDVATILQALVVLDRRYHRVLGWTSMPQVASLGWAALAAALDTSLKTPDYSIDATGWRPRVRPMRGDVPPGILGVLMAEHNVLAGLGGFPHALRLRLVVDSQRVLSSRLSTLIGRTDPTEVLYWETRATTYAEIQRQLRDIGGIWGGGERPAAEAGHVVARLRGVDAGTVVEPRALKAFRTLAEGIDERIASIVQKGIERGDFVQRVKLPRLVASSGSLVQPARVRYRAVPDSNDVPLVRIVREQLRPLAPSPTTAPDASRVQLVAALSQRAHPPEPAVQALDL